MLIFSIAPSFSHLKEERLSIGQDMVRIENLDNSWGVALRHSTRDENIVANVGFNPARQVRSLRELVKVGNG